MLQERCQCCFLEDCITEGYDDEYIVDSDDDYNDKLIYIDIIDDLDDEYIVDSDDDYNDDDLNDEDDQNDDDDEDSHHQ